jgi:hypothetical protein
VGLRLATAFTCGAGAAWLLSVALLLGQLRRDGWRWGVARADAKWEDEGRGRPSADVPEVARVAPRRGRKNRKRWCGGHVGREHVPVVRLSHWGQWRVTRKLPSCVRLEWHPSRWLCTHQEMCSRCGRVMRVLDNRECPDFTEEIT